ncbi:MAG: 30S ribosomal protein S20 [Bacilli bacterium]
MANIKSAKKRVKTNEKKRILNNDVKTTMKTLIKKCEKAVKAGVKEDALKALLDASKAIDKASSKDVIKLNTAARYKSRLTKLVNNLK